MNTRAWPGKLEKKMISALAASFSKWMKHYFIYDNTAVSDHILHKCHALSFFFNFFEGFSGGYFDHTEMLSSPRNV